MEPIRELSADEITELIQHNPGAMWAQKLYWRPGGYQVYSDTERQVVGLLEHGTRGSKGLFVNVADNFVAARFLDWHDLILRGVQDIRGTVEKSFKDILEIMSRAIHAQKSKSP